MFSTFTFMQRKIKVFLESNFSHDVSLDLLANGTYKTSSRTPAKAESQRPRKLRFFGYCCYVAAQRVAQQQCWKITQNVSFSEFSIGVFSENHQVFQTLKILNETFLVDFKTLCIISHGKFGCQEATFFILFFFLLLVSRV